MDNLDDLRKHIALKVAIIPSDFIEYVELTTYKEIGKDDFFVGDELAAKYQAFLLVANSI